MSDEKVNPTPEQQAILNEVRDGTGNLLIEAFAGTGKSTSIVMAVGQYLQVHPTAEILVCAYNKAIAGEMQNKLEVAYPGVRGLSAKTMHSLGFGPVRFAFNPRLEENKTKLVIREIVKHYDNDLVKVGVFEGHRNAITKLVGFAKQEGVGVFDDRRFENDHTWRWLADHYDLDVPQGDMGNVITAAKETYAKSLTIRNVIDFDDMILMPLAFDLPIRFKKDIIFVDEAQDLSRCRQALMKRFVKPGGRIVIVGDRRQSIYAFSGADPDSIPRMEAELETKALPLSVSWRCPRSVVAVAQGIVPGIQAAPNAPDGLVASAERFPADLGAEDAILCRVTAPLISLAYDCIRKGIPCKVEGRSIGEGIQALLQRWKVPDLATFEERLDTYFDREFAKCIADDRLDRAETLEDKVMTTKAIVHECRRMSKHEVADAVRYVDDLFGDDLQRKKVLTLATYHRAKGREWPRVFLLEHDRRCPSMFAKKDWQVTQENNLAYVAFTRAQRELWFIDPPRLPKEVKKNAKG